ncbi:kinase-like domain-containing protein [Amylostereum chailletii]|nr:kinase-like domain-containing protein [Amylostereum chailletii]
MAAATCNIKDNIKDNNNNASLTLSASAAPVSSSIDGQENTALIKTLSSVFRKATIVVGRHFNALLRGSSRPSIASTDSNSSLSPPSSPIPTPISAAYDYKVVKKVGDGTTANVYLVKSKQDNRTLAMKVINKTYIHGLTSANKPLSEQIVQEVKVLRAVAGDGQCHTLSIVSAFHDSVNMYIVTERCITDLWELWKEFDHQFPMVLLKTYAAQIAVGLSALHDAGIIHRDIKPENIFIAADGRAVVGDFGMAYRLEAQKSDDPPTTRGLCGTLNYAAYEMLRDEEYSYPVDWFSYGVLLHVLLNKCYVWDSEDREELVRQMQMIPVSIHPARGDAYHIQTLISGLLDLDADTRYGADEIKTHPFFWNW